ncbi:MAG: SPOR domain-containing protein [Planctomycetaceae bacterium]|nr:SPOR domain-containing protein [Planctomycetaceae bacterium]
MPCSRPDRPDTHAWRLHTRARAAFAPAAAMLLAVAAMMLGAACTPKPEASLANATSAYGRRDYAKAAEQAALAAQTSDGLARAKARYLEGLALLQLGRFDAAADSLRLATDAADRRLAADARVSLGTAEIRRGNYELAAEAYKRAAVVLEGDDARRAHSIAARCFDHAGLTRAAEEERVLAGEPRVLVAAPPRETVREQDRPLPKPPAVAARPAEPAPPAVEPAKPSSSTSRIVNGIEIEPIHFSIQAGAFKERASAEQVARTLREKDAAKKLGAPRIVEKERNGSTLFVVQIGDFPNRAVAGKAVLTLGIGTYTVERYLE